MANKELSPQEQKAKEIAYMQEAVNNDIAKYGEDHAITIEAKEELAQVLKE